MADMSALLLSPDKHPFQLQCLPGPKRPYEVTQMGEGLFVRLDMPGVARNGIKIFKNSEKDIVTFSATAPKKESFPYDESERLYAGIVQLNKDPTDLLVEVSVENGPVILFFPTADGYLLFLPQSRSQAEDECSSSGKSIDQAEGSQKSEENEDSSEKSIDKAEGSAKSEAGESASGESTEGSTTENNLGYINKLKIKGPDGVCEKRVVQEGGQYSLYVRADLPGLEPPCNVVTIEDRCILVFGEPQSLERCRQGARIYLFFVQLQCSCCEFDNLRHDYEDGVLRLFCKIIAPEPGPSAN
ncbi:hypothetical protein Cgig2_020073 [Carnegiea gigantea]|uniref:Uncharacterized protein n=1 Tax=Carnegiea gigantea TaxID=171969 RepID=A0A9Q1QGT5_9CARY|nr:hypothetical protein Cgig2_020073 [Carnegiea gigantea]